MYQFGNEELEAVREVTQSGKLFRYVEGGRCAAFEKQFADYLGTNYVTLTSSGSTAIAAGLVGLGVGPGDEVLVPACTYMASAVAVLHAGAIPVVVEVDDTATMCPKSVEAMIGPRTRCIMPVHMWGLPCDMDAIMAIADKHDLLVFEDAAQAAGVRYHGKPAGSIGHAGGFSFNYFKNITCGEGGAVATCRRDVIDRANCLVDCCNFYWNDRPADFEPFVAAGSRASEFEGAMLLEQLKRLDGMLAAMRSQKKRILEAVADTPLQPIRANDIDGEGGSHVMFLLPDGEAADRFAAEVEGTVAAKTGRHVYTNWTPILNHQAGHHPALNPFNLKENAECRMDYTQDMCADSLALLSRMVFVRTHPDHTPEQTDKIIDKLRNAVSTAAIG